MSFPSALIVDAAFNEVLASFGLYDNVEERFEKAWSALRQPLAVPKVTREKSRPVPEVPAFETVFYYANREPIPTRPVSKPPLSLHSIALKSIALNSRARPPLRPGRVFLRRNWIAVKTWMTDN
ncbi:hypothetical protein SJAG_03510 [Schizosaccharomyces japonicus yFS275]|uniref:Uncharacterized protein n=1 Tax=Schizosaccharomyces japonicus (strain yFS275 / FY16936) TaxID=402676 RepID=B6K4F4_SCHJY|nr:hypothetical protein SJAG_03510 [Schizosaccharomyces japonicus yFS275]EEB08361.1 hypothetical protein SJAG_03510 [Schizosaccharomyces japonicus yFS275]